MRRYLLTLALAIALISFSSIAVYGGVVPPPAGHGVAVDPLLGKWICTEALGDGAKFGFELKPNGNAAAIGTATMQVEHWRRIDQSHIELTEVSIGNGVTCKDVCVYSIKRIADGTLMMTSETGWYKGTFAGTK